jgi:hypothetical protein
MVPWVGGFAEFWHSAGQAICSLPGSRINRIDDAWTPAGWDGLWREPIEIAKQIEPGSRRSAPECCTDRGQAVMRSIEP